MTRIWLIVLAGLVIAVAVKWVLAARQPERSPEPLRLPAPDPNVFGLRGFDFYVRLESERRSQMLDGVRTAVASAGTVYDQGTHAVVLWNDFNPPEELLARVSRDMDTQVIWLAFQKQVDAFGYERWEKGVRVRRLVFGCYEKERTWEHVDGEPEEWEAAAIFGDARLERRLSQNRRLGGDLAYTAEEEAEHRGASGVKSPLDM